MSRTVSVEDGANGYTLTRLEGDTAKLAVKGELTAKLARELMADLEPIAGGGKKARAPRKLAPPPTKPTDANTRE